MLLGRTVAQLARLAESVGLVALDVGARGGISKDLLLLSSAIDFYGFEPDPEECDRLNGLPAAGPWKSTTFLPTALAESDGTIELNLYGRRGCSSKLKAIEKSGAIFSRGDYYIHEGTVTVPAQSLDSMVAERRVCSPAFMKIDVQGMEVECFSGAATTLSNHLVGIRCEVSFFQLYENQPLFAEVDQALRAYDFVPMTWLEFHEWRRRTRTKYPRLDGGVLPYSRGQMMHGDVLYLLHPESLSDDTDAEVRRLVRLALIAICYEQFDHAWVVITRPRVLEFCQTVANVDPMAAVKNLSRIRARKWRGLSGFLRRCMK